VSVSELYATHRATRCPFPGHWASDVTDGNGGNNNFEQDAVVTVGAVNDNADGNAVAVGENGAFGAEFAAVGRVKSNYRVARGIIPPNSHTTVYTIPYTAVQNKPCHCGRK